MDPNTASYGKLLNAPQPASRARQFDLVIIFPHKTSANVRYGDAENSKRLEEPTEKELGIMNQWASKRNAMTHALLHSGLTLSAFYNRDRTSVICKLGLSVDKLMELAEQKKHEIQLKDEYLGAYAEFKRDYQNGDNERFVYSHLYMQHGDEENPGMADMFRTVDRLHLLDYAVRSHSKGCAGLDIGSGLNNGEISAYFPLHEQSEIDFLVENFGNCFIRGKEITKVRDYFGEKIAFYFLWMIHWTRWLFVMGICGLVVFTLNWMEQTPDTFVLLPLGIVVCLCNALFVHTWRRDGATFAMQWGTLGMKDEFEPSRKEFTGDNFLKRINPVTERVDYYYPWRKRIVQIAWSYSVISAAIVVLTFFMACLFSLRHFMHTEGFAGARFVFMVINAMFVELANHAFGKVAHFLTNRENHRTEREFETHLLAKTMVFKFFNCYVSLFYIAFIKSKFSLFGAPLTCMDDDCLIDLEYQLLVFLIFRVTVSNFFEYFGPIILLKYRTLRAQLGGLTWRERAEFFTSDTAHVDMSMSERESQRESYESYDDLEEMLLTYGYANLFVVACPLAPFLVLFFNLLEIYLDSTSLLSDMRRPLPVRVRDQEPWDTAFDVFSVVAIFTNLAVVIFSSTEFAEWSMTEKLVLFVLVEHLIFGVRIAWKAYFPAVPAEVRVLRLKHDHIVRKYLDHVEVEDDDLKRISANRYHDDVVNIADRDEDDEL